MDFKLPLENYQYCLTVNDADEEINVILQNKLPDSIDTEDSKENNLVVINPTIIQMYVDVKTESAPAIQVLDENEDIKVIISGTAELKPQTINKLQLTTVDGGKTWLVDFGNSGDESDQIASLTSEVNNIKTLAQEAKTTAEAATATATEAKNTADAANTAATEAKSTADTANSTAEEAKSTAETANSTATKAKSTADGLSSTVTELQGTLKTTIETANQAKSTAEQAKSTAETATSSITKLESRVQVLEKASAGAGG